MDKQIGPYNIIRLIGTGGMGSVYEAVHSQIQRRAAIKVLHKDYQNDAEFVQRFFNEARAVNIINHPSIVSVYDFGTAVNGSPYIVMEYLEGESLRALLGRSSKLDPELAMRIGKHIASGLAAAHAKHVVHRDLKPVNILLVADVDAAGGERAKILDFGIAKLIGDPSAKQLTRVGVSIGTPAYMSPEQCRSARDVSERSDVYSLGLILFEMLSGAHPFAEARSDAAMMASHIGKPPPPMSSVAPALGNELCALVDRMLTKQPDTRPSAAEAAATLGRLGGSSTGLMHVLPLPPEVLAGTPGQSAPPARVPAATTAGFVPALRQRLQDGRGVVIAAGAAVLLGLIGLVLVVRLLLQAPPAEPAQVHWTIGSEPAGAQLLDATGQVLGTTPLVHARPRGTGVEVLALRHDGYAEQRLPLDTSRDVTQSVTLTPLPPPPPPPVITPPPAENTGRGKRKHHRSNKPTKSRSRHH